jgi:hypothetical protein
MNAEIDERAPMQAVEDVGQMTARVKGLEILLGNAPTTAEDELVPWLKTIVLQKAGGRQARWKAQGGEPVA